MVNWGIDVVGYGNTGYGVFKFLNIKLDINLLKSDQIKLFLKYFKCDTD